MDTTDPDITFDEQGVCNHCVQYQSEKVKYFFTDEESKSNLKKIAEKISSTSKNGYNCLIGLSGGVDSSYVAYLAWKLGLNALCVHFDNGWNSEIAVSNIKKILNKTGFDYETYVINWPEFRDLQRSFFEAGVIDIEMLTDHAIMASMFKIRRQYGIKYVLSGANFSTEHGMPESWLWSKQDLKNIRSIQKKFGKLKIKDFPTMGFLHYYIVLKLKLNGVLMPILNLINYNKTQAMEILTKEFDWQYYGGKHYESVFTKFYQAYVLPTKFNVDKRKVHLSSQIRNGEITRDMAIELLKASLYQNNDLANDKAYVLKKLGFSDVEFDQLMKQSPVPHAFYGSDIWILNLWKKLKKVMRAK